MNNLPPLGSLTCILFSLVLNGASLSNPAFESTTVRYPYLVNNSNSIIYYKPEDRDTNHGLDPDAAYPLAPGESLFTPVDGLVTPHTPHGMIYRVPTGSRVIINEAGIPKPSNTIAKGGLLFSCYGTVMPACDNFAKLANSKQVLYLLNDIAGQKAKVKAQKEKS